MIEWGIVIVVAVAVAVLVRAFVFQTFFIPSASMEPTLKIGDRILVDKLSYHLHAVTRGDIVVFADPRPRTAAGRSSPIWSNGSSACPGTPSQGKGGVVYIDGKQLAEPWLPKVQQHLHLQLRPARGSPRATTS